ncbi:hypothetical protein HYC85_004966 [Camellia sinensis]|uniref:Pentatricopeptide repeat-containing protein n=1 Tax=Camellia sinensis TaxID=4442 RepID=A0A7J7HZP9_CAMSI|nr:hypothetical protein HYC85_004966 [Camellia sinensis]
MHFKSIFRKQGSRSSVDMAADKAFNLQFNHKNTNRSINNQQLENAFKQIQSINQFQISLSIIISLSLAVIGSLSVNSDEGFYNTSGTKNHHVSMHRLRQPLAENNVEACVGHNLLKVDFALASTCTKVHSFNHGLQIHSHVIKSELKTNRFVWNSLLALYFKLGSNFCDTRRVFDRHFVKDVVSWTSMISGYICMGKPRNSIGLFSEMLDFGVEPNGFTLSAVIKACSELGDLKVGRCFHGVVFRRGFDSNTL